MLLFLKLVRRLASVVLFPVAAGLILCICVAQVLHALIKDRDYRSGLYESVLKWPER